MFIFKSLKHTADHSIIKTVYLSLCQSLLGDCISSWGGAAKTLILKVERAQRALLKVCAFLPFLHPTNSVYKHWRVLTVRQLFLLATTIRKHSLLSYDPHIDLDKRRKGSVCTTNFFNHTFTHRFYCFLGDYLYNKVHKTLMIYHLSKRECKTRVMQWLLENILKIVK